LFTFLILCNISFMKRARIYFDLKPRVASLIWYSSTDVLTDAVLQPLFWLEDEVNAMTVGNNTSFQDICKRAYPDKGAPCLRFSVLDYWHHNHKDLQDSFQAGNLRQRVSGNHSTSIEGLPKIPTVLGMVDRDGGGEVIRARSLRSTWILKSSTDPATQADIKAWEIAFEEMVSKFQVRQDLAEDLAYVSTDSLERELVAASRDSTLLGVVGTIFITAFLVIYFADFNDTIKSSSWLGVCGILLILLSMAAGVGMSLYCGIKFTPITLVILFIVLGVGVDDILILLSMWGNAPTELSLEEKNAYCLGEAGVYVTVTTLTTVLALVAGSSSIFPAVAYFSLSAALVLTFNFINIVTAFNALMVLNQRRIAAERLDFCIPPLCHRSPVRLVGFAKHIQMFRQSPNMMDTIVDVLIINLLFVQVKRSVTNTPPKTRRNAAKVFSTGKIDLTVDRSLKEHENLRPSRLSLVALWLLPLIGILAAFYFFTAVKEGMDPRLVVLDDSPFANYLSLTGSKFSHIGEPLYVMCFFDKQLTRSALDHFGTLTDSLALLPTIEGGATISFWRSFQAHFEQNTSIGTLDGEQLKQELLHFKDTIAPMFASDIQTDITGIKAVRVHLNHIYMAKSKDRAHALKSVRNVVDRANQIAPTAMGGSSFVAYSPAYVLWDSYEHVRPEVGVVVVVVS
jgi:hypothetical protein